jgi:hypothetical protein
MVRKVGRKVGGLLIIKEGRMGRCLTRQIGMETME